MTQKCHYELILQYSALFPKLKCFPYKFNNSTPTSSQFHSDRPPLLKAMYLHKIWYDSFLLFIIFPQIIAFQFLTTIIYVLFSSYFYYKL